MHHAVILMLLKITFNIEFRNLLSDLEISIIFEMIICKANIYMSIHDLTLQRI